LRISEGDHAQRLFVNQGDPARNVLMLGQFPAIMGIGHVVVALTAPSAFASSCGSTSVAVSAGSEPSISGANPGNFALALNGSDQTPLSRGVEAERMGMWSSARGIDGQQGNVWMVR